MIHEGQYFYIKNKTDIKIHYQTQFLSFGKITLKVPNMQYIV